jgi:hypothetical protein
MEKRLSNSIRDSLTLFDPISLKEMKGVSLMDRTDTKFIFEVGLLPELLQSLKDLYFCMDLGGERVFKYKTDYFDTPQFDLYTAHHNGKQNRNKIRYREYIESKISFFEIKFKNNKGKTLKKRISSWIEANEISILDGDFMKKNTPFKREDLVHVLTNHFSRLTLVSKHDKERVTMDFALEFNNSSKQKSVDNLVIVEVKQESLNRNSKVIQQLKKHQIYNVSFSKYTTGVAILNNNIKYNNFKVNLSYLNKIHQNGNIWSTTN